MIFGLASTVGCFKNVPKTSFLSLSPVNTTTNCGIVDTHGSYWVQDEVFLSCSLPGTSRWPEQPVGKDSATVGLR